MVVLTSTWIAASIRKLRKCINFNRLSASTWLQKDTCISLAFLFFDIFKIRNQILAAVVPVLTKIAPSTRKLNQCKVSGVNPFRSLLVIIPEAAWKDAMRPPPPGLNIHIWHELETYTRHTFWQKMIIDDVIIQVLLHLYWLQTLSDMLGWQKNYIHDTIMTVTWLGYNLQTD